MRREGREAERLRSLKRKKIRLVGVKQDDKFEKKQDIRFLMAT